MILYHYTALEYLERILEEGLAKGDVPVSPSTGTNAVWLTSDSTPQGHGLTDGSPLSDQQRGIIKRLYGEEPHPDARYPNKQRVRITVVVSSRDRLLKPWMKWARKRLAPDWRERLTITGGGKRKAESWFIYQGIIAPDMFRAVEIRDGNGTYSAITAIAP